MATPQAARSKSPKPPRITDEKKRARDRRYHCKNREKSLQRMRDRYEALSPLDKLLVGVKSKARPSRPRAGTNWAKDPRNAALAQAFCDWSDIDEVIRIYLAAGIMSELTGEPYVVDHVIPVTNPFVCGLHTHTNLEVVSVAHNKRKGNWLWPGMSPLTWESMQMLETLEKFR